jgi:Protein of unknown function (DUF3306)
VSEEFGEKLSRWSQRKAAARRGAALEEKTDDRRTEEAALQPPAEAADAHAVSAEQEQPALPSVEELTAESDYTVFLADNVPESIKRAALARLWRSDPVFANLDGLNDYDEDYNLANSLIASVRSAYKAGKGYADEAEEKLAQADGDAADEAVGDAESDATPSAQAVENDKNDAPVDDADAALPQAGAGQEDEPHDRQA